MKCPRRQFLHLAAAAVVLPAVSRIARAQAYPARPVKLVIGFAPGGSADIEGRLLGQWLSQHLGQSFVLENRPGAGTNIATEVVVNSPPDGYTLLWVTTANAINATLYEKLNFNFLRDIVPAASIDRFPLILEVNPSVPVKTVPELIAYAKANPGKINFASGGVGTLQHVAGELFNFMAGVRLVHVPYRGAALAMNDLLAGQVQVAFSPIPLSISYVHAERLRALAVTSAMRSAALPDTPTVAEFLPGYEAIAGDGLGVPKDTPADIVDSLNRAMNAALADPIIAARMADLGGIPFPGSAADFKKFMAEETEKWAKVIKFAGIKPE